MSSPKTPKNLVKTQSSTPLKKLKKPVPRKKTPVASQDPLLKGRPFTKKSLQKEMRFLGCYTAIWVMVFGVLFFVFRSILSGIFLGCLAAYLMNPLVERVSRATKLPRLAVALSAIFIFGVLLTIGILIGIPVVIRQTKDIVAFFPNAYSYIAETITTWLPVVNGTLESFGIPAINSLDFFKDIISLERFTTFFQGTLGRVLSSVPGLVSFAVSVAMMPFVMYLYLQNLGQTKTFISGLIPSQYQKPVSQIGTRLSAVLKSVILGQIYVAMAVGVSYAVGFLIIGLQGSITIGIASGVAKLVPFMDAVLAVVLSVVVILSTESAPLTPLISSALVITVVGTLDAIIITPRLMGSSAGVHPIIILASVIAFSALMGFWGMIIAVPAVALFKELMVVILAYYKKWQSLAVRAEG